jgi:lipase
MSQLFSDHAPADGDAQVNGLRLHYLDWGGEGTPIVIVHATGFLGRVYRPIALALRSTGHVFSYDQRGHGDSECPPLEEINWYKTADDLEGFLLAMGFRQARAFGHSAGGTAIAAVAAKRPDLIAAAMIVEPVIVDQTDANQRPGDLYERTLKRKPRFDSLAAMIANFAGKPPYLSWDPAVLRDYCDYGTRADAEQRRILKCAPAIEARYYQTARDFDGLSRMLATTVPLLVVFGERTESPGIEFGERIARNAPNCRIAVVPGAGHLVPMEQPEHIARMALQFFADVAVRGA